MNPSSLFQFANSYALLGWILMFFAPKWKWTKSIVFYGVILLLATLYIIGIVPGLGKMDMQSFSSLEGVMALFTSPEAVAIGWIHYLAFDMFVGLSLLIHAQKQGLPHLALIPCLFLCFMFGPIGLLLYIIVFGLIKKKLGVFWD